MREAVRSRSTSRELRWRCESWTIKRAECWRIDAFELWCWRRLLSVAWTARRSNQSILKEISAEYSLQALMLKLQYFGHLMQRTDSLEKTLMLGKIEGWRRRGPQRMRWFAWYHWLDAHEFEQAPGVGDGQGSLVSCSPWGHKELDTTEQLNWGDNSKQRRHTRRNASDLHISHYTQLHNNHMLSKMDMTCCQGTAHLGQHACWSSQQHECDHETGCKTLRKTEKGPNRARSNGQAKATDHKKPGYLFPVSELGKIGKAWRQNEEGAAEDGKVR